MFCKTCRTPLSLHETKQGEFIAWRHGFKTDHKADPIPESQIGDYIELCDFCNREQPEWLYPVEAGVVPPAPGHSGPDFHDDDAWLACNECASLVEKEDWDGLADRCLETFQAPVPDHILRAELKHLWASFNARKGAIEAYNR